MQSVARAARALAALSMSAIFILNTGGLASAEGEPPAAATEASDLPNLKEAAIATGVLSKMMDATHQAGLDDPNIKVGPLTLLAPTDEAFNALPQDVRERLLAPENRHLLTDLLLYHAIPGLYPAERLLNAKVRNYTIQAIDGSAVEIWKRKKTGEIDIAGAKIVQSDVMASDGIIHVIDKVLIPPPVMEALMNPPAEPTEIAAEGDQ